MDEFMGIKDGDSAARIAAFFTAMRLPLPEKGEYYRTSDEGRIVFLTAYGCAVRMTLREHSFTGTHSRCLRPLFSRAAGQFVVEINPGIDCPVRANDVCRINSLLKNEHGIHYPDPGAANYGYLPGTDYPVIVDLAFMDGKIEALSHSAQDIARLLERDPQEKLYSRTRRLFREAWPEDAPRPDAARLAAAWENCAALKAQGLLLSPWESFNYVNTTDAARNYAAKMKAAGLRAA
jgi:hypothetical protein